MNVMPESIKRIEKPTRLGALRDIHTKIALEAREIPQENKKRYMDGYRQGLMRSLDILETAMWGLTGEPPE